jgi:hypothetical protein
MAAVDLQGFFVKVRRQKIFFLTKEDVRYMADGVSKNERSVEGSVQCDCLLIVFESDAVFMQVSGDLPQSCESLGQRSMIAGFAAEIDGLSETEPGIVEAMFSSGLIALVDQLVGRVAGHADRVA